MDSIFIQEFLYLERFVNDGSPTGLTFSTSSSNPTSPLYCPGFFRLPFIKLPISEVQLWGDQYHSVFRDDAGEILFPIHPDILNQIHPSYLEQIVWQQNYTREAFPTASPRTVLIHQINGDPIFLKMDYPMPLGRFSSNLYGEKLWIGPIISSYLTDIKDKEIYFFPEIDAIEAQIYSNGKRSGVLLRPLTIQNSTKSIVFSKIIPAFALFGKNKIRQESYPLIYDLLKSSTNPTEKLITNFIMPLLDSFWRLTLCHGLIPEAHAQNFLYGFHEGSDIPIIIWRDFQGFYRDENLLPLSLAKEEYGGYHLLSRDNKAFAQQMRSFLYDWILGHYFFDPLIETSEKFCSTASDEVVKYIQNITKLALRCNIETGYFPENGWYSMSLNQPSGQQLPLIWREEPRFR